MHIIKNTLKRIFSFLCLLYLLPLLIIYKVQSFFTRSERFYFDCAQFVSTIPGTVGDYIRKEYYKFTLQKCSDTCHIGMGTIISHPDAEIGEYVHISINCMIGTVTIENDVLIGTNVEILDGGHQHFFEGRDIPIRLKPRPEKVRVKIGRDSFIGNRSIIMADVGQGSVVGAATVVVRPIDEYSMVVGNPARLIKKRV